MLRLLQAMALVLIASVAGAQSEIGNRDGPDLEAAGPSACAERARTGDALSKSDLERCYQRLESLTLDEAGAVVADGLGLEAAPGRFRFTSGVLYPLRSADGGVTQFLFVGEAVFELRLRDHVERGQLELFTGQRELEETFDEGVLVVTLDSARKRILSRPRHRVTARDREKAKGVLESWRVSQERRLLAIDSALLANDLGDPMARGFFVGWLSFPRLGHALFVIDPRDDEQVIMGQFVAEAMSSKQTRKAKRSLIRQQRRGRLRGLTVAGLGVWNTWVSLPLEQDLSDGAESAASAGFEAQHYRVRSVLDVKNRTLDGTAQIEIAADGPAGVVVGFSIGPDLEVSSVTDAHGKELFFRQARGDGQVFLERASADRTIELTFRYAGRAFEELDAVGAGRAIVLADTLGWHPHVGRLDLASYALEFDFDAKWEVLATGEVLSEDRSRGRGRLETRIDTKTRGATFEVGRYTHFERRAGDMELRLHVDAFSKALLHDGEALLGHVVDALEYLEATYGELPLERLDIVTVPRSFSQSLQGFVTLSTVMMVDDPMLALSREDPRTVVAHELAHQWFGHRLGWHGDRDLWLSEALANYAAHRYQVDRLGDLRPFEGPLEGWRAQLLEEVHGRPREALGPVVLGPRLQTSLDPSAYGDIVYVKGGMAVDAVAQWIGPDQMNALLRKLVDTADFRALTGDQLIDVLKRSAGEELTGTIERLFLQTQVPEYTVEWQQEQGESGWQLTGRVELLPAVRPRISIEKLPTGGLDARSYFVQVEPSSRPRLVIPFRITTRRDVRSQPESQWGTLRVGDQDVLELDLNLADEVLDIEFDPAQELYALVHDRNRDPVRVIEKQAHRALAVGDLGLGEESLRSALELSRKALKGQSTDDAGLFLSRLSAVRLGAQLAHLAMDRSDLERAGELLKQAEADLGRKRTRTRYDSLVRLSLAKARHQLLSGDARRAMKTLDGSVWGSSMQGRLIYIIAALEVGVTERAREVLRDVGSAGPAIAGFSLVRRQLEVK